jgi:signal peptidase II
MSPIALKTARNRIVGLGVAVLVFAIDRWVKGLMTGPLQLRDVHRIELLPFFDLAWTENRGVSLGMLTAESMEMRWLLVAMTTAIALVVLVWMMREKMLADIAALALVLGGAAGNIFDRASKGFVIDYADLHFGEFRPFLIFNIADAAITIGVLIILARSLLSREKPAKQAAAETAPES